MQVRPTRHFGEQFIDGRWGPPANALRRELINPATEAPFATVAQGADVADVERAVCAARRAFSTYSATALADRIELIDRIIAAYERREAEISEIMALEVGIPLSFRAQTKGPAEHMRVARDLLKTYAFETRVGGAIIRREPIGVCALISPWNWPIQTLAIKAIYGLAAGCSVILKPSDSSPASAILLAQAFAEAGVPDGAFNLLIGRGSVIGRALSEHPDVDMISFTGSTGAGIKVGEAAARSVKRVCLELGGKSANIVLQDADLEKAARWNVQRCFLNSGQSCHAPSRMLVHRSQMEEVIPYLVDEVGRYRVGDPLDPGTTMGPLANRAQFDTVQRYIKTGLDEGARVICGGVGRPEGHEKGYFARPTMFVDVAPESTIAREEIFGPVLCVIPYTTEDEALRIANNSPYGLGGYVFARDRKRGYAFACGLRAGRVCFNGAATNSLTPMGGYKLSGIGRSMGEMGLEEYLEAKSVYGFDEEAASLPDFQR